MEKYPRMHRAISTRPAPVKVIPCRVCGSQETYPVHQRQADQGQCERWVRCICCGSDSNPTEYSDVKHLYDGHYLQTHHSCPTREQLLGSMQSNLEWFQQYRSVAPDRTFLDIGCCEGCGMEGMQARGWGVAGFDVIPEAKTGSHVVVGEKLEARLFRRRYGAVMVREVLEHVPDWQDMLSQCFALLLPGGLLQVQTPRPWFFPDPVPYQTLHLQLFSPAALRAAVEEVGFRVLEYRSWVIGHAVMAQKA